MGTLDLEESIVAAIRRIIRAIDVHSRRLVEAYGLTGPQLATLREVQRQGPVSPGALARAVHLSNPTVTGILTRLERRGLVIRRRSPDDRRSVDVTVTPAGLELLDRAPSLLQDRFHAELDQLEGWERHMILANLQRVAAMMNADVLDAAPHLTTGGSPSFGDGSPPPQLELRNN